MKTKERLIEENNHLKIAGAIIVICLLVVVIGLTFKLNNENKNVCYDFKSLNETLKDIENNCGSTQITTKWDSEDWFVFIASYNNCNGISCESEYIPIDECLN